MMLLIGSKCSFWIGDAFAAQHKCSSRILIYQIQAITCQGLERHPFQGKDIVESPSAGTAKEHQK